MQSATTIILDCYTDEPSGYGVPPYLSSHVLHLSQALGYKRIKHSYLTIDDLRVAVLNEPENTIRTINTTRNCHNAGILIAKAEVIYIVMGCFVQYDYFSAAPPMADEVASLITGTNARVVLFYVMGVKDGIAPSFRMSRLSPLCSQAEHGNTYRAILENRFSSPGCDLINPNYLALRQISTQEPQILADLKSLRICEIETGTGCNTPTCSFCIESERSPKVTYREPDQIIAQIKACYDMGIRHFRLGRQPNFFHYMRQDASMLKKLLYGIRAACHDLRMLHIDNVNIINVITASGRLFAKLISEFCTSGNIAPFGIESFDDTVRQQTKVIGSSEDVHTAIDIINEFGSDRAPDGQPKFLPGINLIYGLPGQSEQTHAINMNHLQRILDRGVKVQRLYYRNITQSTGASFGDAPAVTEQFRRQFSEIVTSFVMPMQNRVYPTGTVITGDWEKHPTAEIIRAIGTCAIKIACPAPLKSPVASKVRIVGNLDYRLLRGESFL